MFWITRDKNVKSFQRGKKNQIIYKESEIKMASYFSAVSLKGRRLWSNAFRALRGNCPTWNPIVRETVDQVGGVNEDMEEDEDSIPGRGSERVKPEV